jgi:hypothetical protein
MDISLLWPSDTDGWYPKSVSDFGQIGDYISGVWGTGISILTLLVVFLTWRLTRQADARNGIISLLVEMLKTHDNIVPSDPNESARFLEEFYRVYKATKQIVHDQEIWSTRNRIDISYVISYYGISTHSSDTLSCYGDENIKNLQDSLAKLRDRAGGKYSGYFTGHQKTMSHYMRNLFSMYVLLDQSGLKKRDKLNLGKIIRTKLSNHDQAVLSLNMLSQLGVEWERQGLIAKYKPIANIPKNFFGYDARISLKLFFPYVEFEWEKENPLRRPIRKFSAFGYSIIFSRQDAG